jgi:hypothetical protein
MPCRMPRLLEMKIAMHSALLIPFLLLYLAIEISLSNKQIVAVSS